MGEPTPAYGHPSAGGDQEEMRTITKITPTHHPTNFAKIRSYSLLFSACTLT